MGNLENKLAGQSANAKSESRELLKDMSPIYGDYRILKRGGVCGLEDSLAVLTMKYTDYAMIALLGYATYKFVGMLI